MKQLEKFLRCLTNASDYNNNLAKLRNPLQQKLKKKVSWTWTPNDSMIVLTLKRSVKIFLFLICLMKEMI